MKSVVYTMLSKVYSISLVPAVASETVPMSVLSLLSFKLLLQMFKADGKNCYESVYMGSVWAEVRAQRISLDL